MQIAMLKVKLKFLVFFFVLLVMRKVQTAESVNVESDCKTLCKKRINLSCVFKLQWKKYKKVESVIRSNT